MPLIPNPTLAAGLKPHLSDRSIKFYDGSVEWDSRGFYEDGVYRKFGGDEGDAPPTPFPVCGRDGGFGGFEGIDGDGGEERVKELVEGVAETGIHAQDGNAFKDAESGERKGNVITKSVLHGAAGEPASSSPFSNISGMSDVSDPPSEIVDLGTRHVEITNGSKSPEERRSRAVETEEIAPEKGARKVRFVPADASVQGMGVSVSARIRAEEKGVSDEKSLPEEKKRGRRNEGVSDMDGHVAAKSKERGKGDDRDDNDDDDEEYTHDTGRTQEQADNPTSKKKSSAKGKTQTQQTKGQTKGSGTKTTKTSAGAARGGRKAARGKTSGRRPAMKSVKESVKESGGLIEFAVRRSSRLAKDGRGQ